jgi:hypothetical protein
MKILVKTCNDCPMCVTDFNPDSMGADTVVRCNLQINKLPDYNLLAVYNSYEEEDDDPMELIIPDECILNNSQIIITNDKT